ncbi:GumC family protein [Arhodomonas sp. AD133]|uniref:GumC family protein n=1 Tax=Arhodomonas sp. AD133 TaxID=3415009 RepID=UPI003EB8176D
MKAQHPMPANGMPPPASGGGAAAPAPPGGPAAPGLMEYVRVLLRSRRLIVAVVASAVLAAGGYTMLQPRMYLGSLTMQVQPDPPAYVPSLQQNQAPAGGETFFTTQLDIIRSRAVAERVVDRLTEAERRDLMPPPGVADQVRGVVDTALGWAGGMLGLGGGDAAGTDAGEPAREVPDRRSLVRLIQNNLQVRRRKDSELVELLYQAPTADVAARVANLVASAYQGVQERQRVEVSERVHDWLVAQLDKLRQNLAASEQAVQAYKSRHDLLDSRNLEEVTGKQLSSVTQDLLDARSERMRVEVLYNQVQEAENPDALAAVLEDPVIQQLKLQQARLRGELERLRSHYGENASKVASVRAELESVSARLDAELERSVASISQRYEQARQREERLVAAEKDLNEGLRDRSDVELGLAKLEREAETNRELYEAFRSRIKEINLTGAMGNPGIRILDRALPPGAPFKPNPVRILAIAGLLSGAAAVALAFLMNNLRQRFYTPQGVEEHLPARGLGMVPKVELRRPAMLPRYAVLEPASGFTEAVGAIRTRLQVGDRAGAPQMIMVTSALQAEGKSTLSSNLACSYAQIGRTLLIDGDLRRASLSSHWQRPGLTDFVLRRARPRDCIARDGLLPNLYLMGKGHASPHPLEFFATDDLTRAFAALRRHFDWIVIDTAPVLTVSDVEMMGHLSDGAILAVQAGKTPTDAVSEAYRRLLAAQVRMLGVTLTQVDLKEVTRYGGYAYGVQ